MKVWMKARVVLGSAGRLRAMWGWRQQPHKINLGYGMNRNAGTWVSLSGFLLLIAGCASSPPVTISVAPSGATIFSTQSVQLSATDNYGSSDVVWSVSAAAGAPA